MIFASYAAVFALGTVVGSFLNVVVFRYNSGRGLGGRSSCGSCGRVLAWHELLPVVSYAFRRGRCRSCRAKISYQYPLVEFFTGVLFVVTFVKFPLLPTTYHLLLFCLLVVIFVYDLRHKIIPDGIVYAFDALAFGRVIPLALASHPSVSFWIAFAGPGVALALPFALLWLVSRGRWMGLGDAKLVLGFGWLLGLRAGFSAVVLGIWLGAAFSIAVMALQYLASGAPRGQAGRLTMKSEIPLAPFLILGFLLVFFFNIDILAVFAAYL